MKLKGVTNIGSAAWAGGGRVQIQLGGIRFTATPDEAVELARKLIGAVDELRAASEVPDGQ